MIDALERAQAGARREDDLRRDLDAFRRNVACQRIEPDPAHEARLLTEIAEAEAAWRRALAERRAERRASEGPHVAPFARWLPVVLEHSSTINSLESKSHGERHWERVSQLGERIAALLPAADLAVVQLFAVFHDSMRLVEWSDPEHGARAWSLALEVGATRDLEPAQADRLQDACVRHDRGCISDDPTIGACWDADRLDLGRVGVRPDPAYMSTEAGRDMAGGAV